MSAPSEDSPSPSENSLSPSESSSAPSQAVPATFVDADYPLQSIEAGSVEQQSVDEDGFFCVKSYTFGVWVKIVEETDGYGFHIKDPFGIEGHETPELEDVESHLKASEVGIKTIKDVKEALILMDELRITHGEKRARSTQSTGTDPSRPEKQAKMKNDSSESQWTEEEDSGSV